MLGAAVAWALCVLLLLLDIMSCRFVCCVCVTGVVVGRLTPDRHGILSVCFGFRQFGYRLVTGSDKPSNRGV